MSSNALAELRYRDRSSTRALGGGPQPEVDVVFDVKERFDTVQIDELLDSVSVAVEGHPRPRGFAVSDLDALRGSKVIVRLLRGTWELVDSRDVSLPRIRLVLSKSSGGHDELWLEITHNVQANECWIAVGNLGLRYGPGPLTPDLERFARGIEVLLERTPSIPIAADSGPIWASLAQNILEKMGLASRYRLEVVVG